MIQGVENRKGQTLQQVEDASAKNPLNKRAVLQKQGLLTSGATDDDVEITYSYYTYNNVNGLFPVHL